MLRRILLLALLTLAPSSTLADDLDCPANGNGDLTMQAYTNCLINKYGSDSLVTDGTVAGSDSGGKAPFINEYSAPMSSNSLIVALTPICTPSTIIYSQLTGSTNYNWCPTPSVVRQDTREKWYYQLGRWRLTELKFYNCNVAGELAAMPQQVKSAVCP